MRAAAVLVLLGAGCSSIFGIHDPVPAAADAAQADAELDGPIDGPVDAPSDAPMVQGGSPLLLTEVVLAPTQGEFLEIVNTSDQTIDLSQFHLADHGQYFRLPATAPVIDASDFIARFPAGATIGPKQVATISIASAADFTALYGVAPTFSIAGGGSMIVVAGNPTPSLTNEGEVIILFRWDGASDLVEDADIILAGNPSAANTLMNKGGASQDGADPDADASTYKADANTIAGQNPPPASGQSTKRIALEDGNETQIGTGNGIGGDDESSEKTSLTWDSTVFSAPTPGAVPPALQ